MSANSTIRRSWTDSEDGYIGANWTQQTDAEIGGQIDRTESAVATRRWQLGYLKTDDRPKPPGMKPWSAEDTRMLHRCFREGLCDLDIAATLGRTPGAVAQRRSTEGLLRDEPPQCDRENPIWPDDDDQLLRLLFMRDKTDNEIAGIMNRTVSAIRCRRQTLHLWRDGRDR